MRAGAFGASRPLALRSTTILTTKLNVPPPRSDWVSRPRLMERLDEGLARKVTLVCAPAGSGKTTLLRRVLVERDKARG